MKQFIVMMAMIALGMILYGLIAGNDEGSILSALKGVWAQELQERTRLP